MKAWARGSLLLLVTAACSRSKEPPVAARAALADSADQTMFGAHQILTDRGLMRADLRADTAYFFDEGTRIEMRRVNLVFFNTNGVKNATLTSLEGTYNTRLQTMEARRNVVVIGEDGRQMTTSQLRYNQVTNEISSDSAFVLTEPGRRLEGVGFRSDPNMNNIRILRTLSGNAGATTLPGQ